MSYYAIPTIARITEQGNPCLLPYVINVSSSGTHDSVTKPSSLSAFCGLLQLFEGDAYSFWNRQ